MSVDRTFTISIAERNGKKPSSVYIINCFLKFGWSLYSSQNKIIYTDLGDSDEFDFLNERITESEYFRTYILLLPILLTFYAARLNINIYNIYIEDVRSARALMTCSLTIILLNALDEILGNIFYK